MSRRMRQLIPFTDCGLPPKPADAVPPAGDRPVGPSGGPSLRALDNTLLRPLARPADPARPEAREEPEE